VELVTYILEILHHKKSSFSNVDYTNLLLNVLVVNAFPDQGGNQRMNSIIKAIVLSLTVLNTDLLPLVSDFFMDLLASFRDNVLTLRNQKKLPLLYVKL
jgi:hypothetical protein